LHATVGYHRCCSPVGVDGRPPKRPSGIGVRGAAKTGASLRLPAGLRTIRQGPAAGDLRGDRRLRVDGGKRFLNPERACSKNQRVGAHSGGWWSGSRSKRLARRHLAICCRSAIRGVLVGTVRLHHGGVSPLALPNHSAGGGGGGSFTKRPASIESEPARQAVPHDHCCVWSRRPRTIPAVTISFDHGFEKLYTACHGAEPSAVRPTPPRSTRQNIVSGVHIHEVYNHKNFHPVTVFGYAFPAVGQALLFLSAVMRCLWTACCDRPRGRAVDGRVAVRLASGTRGSCVRFIRPRLP